MTSQKPLLVVLGATGNQGGSIISHFLSLSPSPYALRAVTRDPSSAKATSLASRGVDVVTGNFDEPSSLEAAFKGASAIFSVTDFWYAYADPSQREKAVAAGQSIGAFCREYEAQQGRNIIDAAAKVDTLDRFIFSALPNATKVSGGKYTHVYHFDGKGIAEEYGRSAHPKLWEKTTVLYAGLFLENLLGPTGAFTLPKLNEAKDTLTLTLADPVASAPLPMYSVVDDTGVLVQALLLAAPGKRIVGVKEWLSYRGFATTLARTLKKGIEFVDVNPDLSSGDPELDQEHMDMMGFCVEFGYDGGLVDKSIVQPADLGVSANLLSTTKWCEKQDWDSVLQVSP
ncbi:putative hscarg dehydrogenase [Thozetella sp. PMI_491]|nr:putative hscarg dehydrogenase [Thozetella sp. PMI_491]